MKGAALARAYSGMNLDDCDRASDPPSPPKRRYARVDLGWVPAETLGAALQQRSIPKRKPTPKPWFMIVAPKEAVTPTAASGPFPTAQERLSEFSTYGFGWDGAHATGPSSIAVRLARRQLTIFSAVAESRRVSLSEPEIGLGEDGSVGFEWRAEGRQLYLTVQGDGAGAEYWATGPGVDFSAELDDLGASLALAMWLAFGDPLVPER